MKAAGSLTRRAVAAVDGTKRLPLEDPHKEAHRQGPYPPGIPAQPASQQPRLDWRYEEIVLVCDLVVANGWRALDRRSDERVVELSDLLRSMSPQLAAKDPKFRNVEGVGRKAYDIATAHPDYAGEQTKGGKTTMTVVNAFVAEPTRMRKLAKAIRSAATDQASPPQPADLDSDQMFDEGHTFERRHLARERDPRARARKITKVRQVHGLLQCEACGFDFEATYGERGRDFIECHHRNPLSVVGPTTTSLQDLALLCSNCHRMIHRYRPWLTVEQLTDLVQKDI